MNTFDLLAAARGDIPCDLVLRNARIANVFTFEYEEADVAIFQGRIVGVGEGYEGRAEENLSGLLLTPGFIDGHCHIESTMLTPAGFSELVSVRGTSAVIADPHEIANTCGMTGIEFMWKESLGSPVDIFFAAPSCVPASPFETPFEELGAAEVSEMFRRGWCDSLGEVMNYPGVIGGDKSLWDKILAAESRVCSGHAPGITGKDLCAYLMSGCDSDHESFSAEEGLEKLRRGMWLMIREGATEHNLADLAPLVKENEARSSRCMLVSDDLTARCLRDIGHMDEKIRAAIGHGISPIAALRMATLSPAEYFGKKDRGAIAPGRLADIVAVDSLELCSVIKVWKEGRLTAENGKPLYAPLTRLSPPQNKTGNITVPNERDFEIPVPPGSRIRTLGLRKGQVVTDHLLLEPSVVNGMAVADPSRDICRLAVLEKNRGTGRLALGFVQGLGIKEGALGSSVAHDAHNFIVAGTDIPSLVSALSFLVSEGGGVVATRGEQILASLPLPVGGLMNPGHADDVIIGLENVERAAASLGTDLEHPFMSMSFLSLSVIPELKLTDQGYTDLSRGGIQPLIVKD